jgi:hypothetical protein
VGQRAFTLQRLDLGVEQFVIHGDLAHLGFQPGDLVVAVIAFAFFQGSGSEALGAIGESVVFLDHFKDLPDPRQRGKIIYPLAEVLLLCLLAVLGGAETFVDIVRFGEKKIDLLRRFRPFRDGTPSHDHLGDIFATLDAEAFQRCFVSWVAALTGAPADVIAIDSKTLRCSYQKKGAPILKREYLPTRD